MISDVYHMISCKNGTTENHAINSVLMPFNEAERDCGDIKLTNAPA